MNVIGRVLLRGLGIALSAVLMIFAFPPQRFGLVVLIALVPLLLAVRNTRWWVGMLAGPAVMCAMGLVYYKGLMREAMFAIELEDAALAACVMFGTTLGVPTAIAAGGTWTIRRMIVIAAAGACGEGVLLILLPGHLALALERQQVAMMVASVGGIWLVTLLVWWVNLSIAGMIAEWETKYAVVLLALIPVVGGLCLIAHMQRSDDGDAQARELLVAAIQDDSAASMREYKRRHLAASRMEDDARCDMVVWPELSGAPIAEGGVTDRLIEIAGMPGASPFVTSFRDDHGPMPHNTAAVFSKGAESARYWKRHLYAEECTIHAPGAEPRTVMHGGVRYGLAICFDSCFPSDMRVTARTMAEGDGSGRRPEVILLPTLDPPDHTGFIQAMHAAFTPFRAAETGLPIVRADITSRSMIVDRDGRVVSEGIEGGEDIIRGPVMVGYADPPLAMVVGDGVLYGCAGVVLIGFVFGVVGLAKEKRWGAEGDGVPSDR
jgi:apolipoprotein N-acyltransferase